MFQEQDLPYGNTDEVIELMASQDTRHSQILRIGMEVRTLQQRLKELDATIQVKVCLFVIGFKTNGTICWELLVLIPCEIDA